jgi:hypothetical protein
MNRKNMYVERRPEGDFAVRRPGSEQWFMQSFVLYVNFLKDGLGIAPPYRWN